MKIAGFLVAVVLLGSLSCAGRKHPLDVHTVLGRSPEELIERWGEPRQYREDPGVGEKYGFALWTNLMGARVFIVIKRGRVTWVTYRFEDMKPFDETEAFRIIHVKSPTDEPEYMPGDEGAKRWEPFEKYGKMVVSPPTKLVAVGWDPRLPVAQTLAALDESGLGARAR